MKLWLAITSAVIVAVSGPVLAGPAGGSTVNAVSTVNAHVALAAKAPAPAPKTSAKTQRGVLPKSNVTPGPVEASATAPLGVPADDNQTNGTQFGIGTHYDSSFNGKPTASGVIMDPRKMTAAHPTLPMFSRVLVTNLDNGQSVEVTVNDRGPFIKGRVIDLTPAAATAIDLRGKAAVRIERLTPEVIKLANAPFKGFTNTPLSGPDALFDLAGRQTASLPDALSKQLVRGGLARATRHERAP